MGYVVTKHLVTVLTDCYLLETEGGAVENLGNLGHLKNYLRRYAFLFSLSLSLVCSLCCGWLVGCVPV